MRTASATAEIPSPLYETARQAMVRARAFLVLEHPFFGSLALRLLLKEDPSCRDLWTDGRTLAFNPVFAASLPEQKLIGAQAHEILHLAFGHHIRRKGRDEDLWNRACDYAVNQILSDAGFSLPEGFLHSPEYKDMPVDEIYRKLAVLQERESNNGARSSEEQGSGSGDASGSKNGSGKEVVEKSFHPSTQTSTQNKKTEENFFQNDTAADSGIIKEKSKTDGTKAETAGQSNFRGEVRDHPDTDGIQNSQAQKTAEQEADIALTMALQRAKNMGRLPAGLHRLLRRAIAPVLDWRQLLQRFLEQCAEDDTSWSIPNRRYVHQNIYLPSRREPRIGHVLLAVDSSGSVDEQSLAVFCTELSGILDVYDTRLTVLFHDTKVQSSCTFRRQDLPISLSPKGGGGTDFRPVGDYIDEQQLHPSCLIWFTDMQCDRFPEEPCFPVLWVCSGGSSTTTPPPFGEAIFLSTSLN